MIESILNIFTGIENTRKEVIVLGQKIREEEKIKEKLIKKLWEAEEEILKLKEERDRFKNLCKIKDIIIEGDKKCCRK